ncbi:hypothetical protein RA210_U280016 [Rubrivivax sp. A210]|nr:hypothetical protein RA210_U280016 [Rubrivivax sp. A210]
MIFVHGCDDPMKAMFLRSILQQSWKNLRCQTFAPLGTQEGVLHLHFFLPSRMNEAAEANHFSRVFAFYGVHPIAASRVVRLCHLEPLRAGLVRDRLPFADPPHRDRI